MPDQRGYFTAFAAPIDLAWIVAVGSSNVDAFRWWPPNPGEQYRQWLDDPTVGYTETGVLEVRFLNHSVYQYYPVPKMIYTSMISASSRGKYVHQVIRQGGFPYIRVS